MNIDRLDAITGRIKVVTANPTTVIDYYGSDGMIESDEWRGGEVVFNTADNRIYVQRNTSGTTAEWRRTANKNTFATSTTSSSSSSSSSSSTSSSSSSSSSTTSTSTSTSSSTSSSSSSSSSTTTMV